LLGPRFVVSVWAVIFDEGGQVLLFRHTHDRGHPWGLPSGRLEAGETPEAGISREFREEVGGEIRVGQLVAALREPQLPALRLVYACQVVIPPTAPSVEVDAWAYFAPADLPTCVRPIQREAITRARMQSGKD
jgi:ADP-ribose pyrophosphatase YjhB (NUDIX family)